MIEPQLAAQANSKCLLLGSWLENLLNYVFPFGLYHLQIFFAHKSTNYVHEANGYYAVLRFTRNHSVQFTNKMSLFAVASMQRYAFHLVFPNLTNHEVKLWKSLASTFTNYEAILRVLVNFESFCSIINERSTKSHETEGKKARVSCDFVDRSLNHHRTQFQNEPLLFCGEVSRLATVVVSNSLNH